MDIIGTNEKRFNKLGSQEERRQKIKPRPILRALSAHQSKGRKEGEMIKRTMKN
jgi:hypothetical protein